MHFFEKADLPMRDRKLTFVAADRQFDIEISDDGFIVQVKSDISLPKHLAMRVEEALRFLLAQSVRPRAIVQPKGIRITTMSLKSPKVRFPPPISRGSAAFYDKTWDLFGSYLVYVLSKTKVANWNPCTGFLHMAHESSANSLDAWAVGLAVAVEGLASLIDYKKDKAEHERLNTLKDFIVKQVSSDERHKAFSKRIEGLVSGLTSVRAIDRMMWLADHAGAERADVEAWKKLRNRGVHPVTIDDVDVASLDFQKIIDDLHRVTVLLYHIVFYMIGYRGPYTDYATRNFPEKTYPLASSSPEQDGCLPNSESVQTGLATSD